MKRQSFIDGALSLIGILLVAIIGTAVFSVFDWHSAQLDRTAYVDDLITLLTGAAIAAFLTLFHSEQKRVTVFREYKRAAGTIYLTLIVNSFIAVVGRLVMSLDSSVFGVSLPNLVVIYVTLLTIQAIAYLLFLFNIYIKA